LKDQVFIVTGASSGIGEELCRRLIDQGATVRGVARSEGALKKLQSDLGSRFSYSVADVGNWIQVKQCTDEVFTEFGKVDGVINNAGFGIFKPAEDMEPEEFTAMIQTNLTGAFYFSKAAIPYLKLGGGQIVNIASVAGKQAIPNGSGYNASKFGMVGLSESLMLELRPFGIRVSCICPGSVETPFFRNVPASLVSDYKLTTSDIAESILYVLRQPRHMIVDTLILRPSGRQI